MNVLPVLDAVLARLREKLPQLQVEYFPEKPAEYRLNHPVGALLLSYAVRALTGRMIPCGDPVSDYPALRHGGLPPAQR